MATAYKGGIPKIIHQMWNDRNVPEKWQESPKEWKRLHPSWEYKLWTTDEYYSLIAEHYPWFLDKFNSYEYKIQRIDAARYFILYHYGGLYSDLDIVPKVSLDNWFSDLGSAEAAFVYSANSSSCLTNAIMASKQRAPIWQEMFTRIQCPAKGWALTKHFKVMTTTGPMALTEVVQRGKYSHSVVILPTYKFNAYSEDEVGKGIVKTHALLYPLEGSSWCSSDTFVYLCLNRHKYACGVVIAATVFVGILALIWYIVKYGLAARALNKCRSAFRGTRV